MADNLKLAQGLRNLPASARQDLAQREEDIQRGKTVELLRRAGKEMYDNPIVNTAIGFTPVLGDVQATGETMAALNRGAPWQETAGYAVGMLPFMPMIGKTVWHGSPHTFEKFDLSKIGTGEGAQAYGHGLYFADAPSTAMTYQPRDPRFEQNIMQKYSQAEKAGNYPAMQVYEDFLLHKNPDEIRSALPEFGLEGKDLEQAQNALDYAAKQYQEQTAGSLYKVDLPDEQIAKMLDWDKPLSEQPESVRNALNQFNTEYGEMYPMLGEALTPMEQSATTGQTIYNILGKESPENASKMLRNLEIPGIQYLDQASRGAGDGTRNYVVFSDEIPQILERNNQVIK